MPELPEVETVRRGLVPVMEGQQITRADVNRADLRWPFPEGMAGRLTGATVVRLRRRSKYILADLNSGETLLIHLGMSGRMLITGAMLGNFHHEHRAPEKHDHVVFHMGQGARIIFNDARRFGAMDLMQTAGADSHWLMRDPPEGTQYADQVCASGSADRGGPWQHLCLRGFAPRGNSSCPQGWQHLCTTCREPCPVDPPSAGRSHRRRWIILAGLPSSRRRIRLFSTRFRGLWSRRRTLRHPRLRRRDKPYCTVRAVLLLLPAMSKIA